MNADVIKSFLLRSVVSGVLAALAYATASIQDVHASPETAALVVTAISYVGHLVHALAVKFGVDPTPPAI